MEISSKQVIWSVTSLSAISLLLAISSFANSLSMTSSLNEKVEKISLDVASLKQSTQTENEITAMPADDFFQEKMLEFYKIPIQIPHGWNLKEIKYTKKDLDYSPGKETTVECAKYEIYDFEKDGGNKPTILSIEPSCGFAEGFPDLLPDNATIFKKLNDKDFLARIPGEDKRKWTYVKGFTETDKQSASYNKKLYNAVLTSIKQQVIDNGPALLSVNAEYDGPAAGLSNAQFIVDQIILQSGLQ